MMRRSTSWFEPSPKTRKPLPFASAATIVAEGLAQRNPQLKAQIANSHKQFRSQLNSAHIRGRPAPVPRTMRGILEDAPVVADATDDSDDDNDDDIIGYQQNAIRATAADELDFEACFEDPTANSATIHVADEGSSLPASESVHLDATPDPIQLRRLAETYDCARQLSFAHADNGSMACTANNWEWRLPGHDNRSPRSNALC
jgi:hypothetical protein